MNDFARRLSSRKFLIALAAFVTALGAGEQWAAVATAAAYLLAEALVDRESLKVASTQGVEPGTGEPHDAVSGQSVYPSSYYDPAEAKGGKRFGFHS